MEVDYKYDAWGNLVERDDYPTGSGSPTVTRYAVDGWNPALAGSTGDLRFNVWADLSSSNSLLTRYLHGDQLDQLFARQDAGVQYWYLNDYQGSVRDALDNSGNVKDAVVYDGFGNIISETNSTYRGSYAWTGRMFDVETGLQYNRARWYDPGTGRWQSQDPMGLNAGDSNLYRYVNNRATNSTDPSGLVVEIQTAFGLWKIELPYAPTQQQLPPGPPVPAVQVKAAIWFYPTVGRAASLEKLAFIQIVQTKDSNGNVNTNVLNTSLAGRLTTDGWGIDRQVNLKNSWWGMNNAGTIVSPNARIFDPKDAKANPSAFMRDWSGTSGLQVTSEQFETYVAEFTAGGKPGAVYCGLQWGWSLNPNGPVTAKTKVVASAIDAITYMSPEFRNAVAAWNSQKGNNQTPLFYDAL